MDPSKQSSASFDFQDFAVDSTLVELDTSDQQTHTFKQFPDSAVDEDLDGEVEENKLLGDEKSTTSAIWTVEYYRQYFNVDTCDVRDRCLWSMVPKPGTNFLKDRLQHNPDLYGPFWIGVTLVISIAVMGNLANYLQVAAHGDQYQWRYDFHKLTLAATVVFCYSCLVPIALWAVFWWRGAQTSITLLQLICLYGYSLTVYIPISVLCASGVWQLQWAVMLVGFAVSGAVLATSLWSALSEEQRKVALAVVAVVLLLHLALAAGFLLYFFRAPMPAAGVKSAGSAASSAAPAEAVASSQPATSEAAGGAQSPMVGVKAAADGKGADTATGAGGGKDAASGGKAAASGEKGGGDTKTARR